MKKLSWWCESFLRLGLQIHLPQNDNEQKFVNSLTPYNSNWLRIQFQNHEIHSDDEFRGESWQQSGKLLSVFYVKARKNSWMKKWRLLPAICWVHVEPFTPSHPEFVSSVAWKAIIINEFLFSNSFIKTVKIQENWIRMRDLSIIIDKYRG